MPSSLSSMLETMPTSYFLRQAVHRGVRLAKGQPVGDAVGQELGPRGLDLPAQLARDLDDRPPQDLRVELVGAGHDLGLDLEEALQERLLLEAEPVLLGLLAAGVDDPLLPVDQGAVAVSGDPVDVLQRRQRHGKGAALWQGGAASALRRSGLGSPLRAAGIGCRGRTWTCSNTRGSGCSPSTACPFPSGRHAASVDEAVAAAERSAIPAWSRLRCDRQARQGRGNQGRQGRGRAAGPRRGDPGDGHPRPHGEGHSSHLSGSRRHRRSPPSTTRRSSSTAPRRSCWRSSPPRGGWTSRRSPRTTPPPLVKRHIDPSAAFGPEHAGAIVADAGDPRGRPRAGRGPADRAARGRDRGGRDADRGQPADRHRRAQGRSRSTPR